MWKAPSLRTWQRELLAALFFTTLSVMVTWPLAKNLGHAVSDAGDPYLVTWILDWNHHALTSGDVSLFHANMFHPARWSLAFSEHFIGVALPLLPLYLAGLTPLEIYGIAMIVGFAFCGYGAWRLAHTVTGSVAGSIAAGIFFAFVPYRLDHLAHLHVIWSGWVPLVLASLITLRRDPSRRNAVLYGVAFFANGVSNIHWLLFVSIATVLTVPLLATFGAEAERRRFWRAWLISTAVAALLIVPTLIPYSMAAREHGMRRTITEAQGFSAAGSDWLLPPYMSRRYSGSVLSSLGVAERSLFPGIVPLLLALVALTPLARRTIGRSPGLASSTGASTRAAVTERTRFFPSLFRRTGAGVGEAEFGLPAAATTITEGAVEGRRAGSPRWLVYAIDAMTVLALAAGFLGKWTGAQVWLFPAAVLLIWRWTIAFPQWLDSRYERLTDWARHVRLDTGVIPGLVWMIVGFAGSFGVNGALHGFLFEYLPPFRAIRVPARWAVISYAGMALLIAIGVAALLRNRQSWRKPVVAAGLILLLAWDIEPRPITWHLAPSPVASVRTWLRELPRDLPIAELPMTDGDFEYLLEATAHHRPLVNGTSGFAPREHAIAADMAESSSIPDGFLPQLRKLGAKLVIVHADRMGTAGPRYRAWLARERNRMRLIGKFDHAVKGDYVFWIGDGEPPMDRSGDRDPAGRTAHQSFELFLVSDGPVFSGVPAGVVESPAPGAAFIGEGEIRGWASSPDGVRSVRVLIDGGERRYDAQLEPRPDIAHQYPWYADGRLTGFRLGLPRRPRGLGLETNLQIEVVDNKGRRARLETVPFQWFHAFPRVSITAGEWAPERLGELVGRLRLDTDASIDTTRILNGETTILGLVPAWVEKRRHLSDKDFVRAVYGVFFEREADEVGLTMYSRELQDGFPRSLLIEKMMGSEEFRRAHLR